MAIEELECLLGFDRYHLCDLNHGHAVMVFHNFEGRGAGERVHIRVVNRQDEILKLLIGLKFDDFQSNSLAFLDVDVPGM